MISIKSNDRALIIGKTGSGKSYWIKKMLPSFNRFIFYDPKHQHNDVKALLVKDIKALRSAFYKYPKIIYRPFVPNDDEFNEICRICYFRGNMTLILDEVSYHVSSNRIQHFHKILMTTGRTRGIGVWNCTQRPREVVHNVLISETDHVICFRLNLLTDRKKLAESFSEIFMTADELTDYKYIYYNERLDIAETLPPI